VRHPVLLSILTPVEVLGLSGTVRRGIGAARCCRSLAPGSVGGRGAAAAWRATSRRTLSSLIGKYATPPLCRPRSRDRSRCVRAFHGARSRARRVGHGDDLAQRKPVGASSLLEVINVRGRARGSRDIDALLHPLLQPVAVAADKWRRRSGRNGAPPKRRSMICLYRVILKTTPGEYVSVPAS
jgi:hypothetical protein